LPEGFEGPRFVLVSKVLKGLLLVVVIVIPGTSAAEHCILARDGVGQEEGT